MHSLRLPRHAGLMLSHIILFCSQTFPHRQKISIMIKDCNKHMADNDLGVVSSQERLVRTYHLS